MAAKEKHNSEEGELVERATSLGVVLFGIRHHVLREQAVSGLVIGYSRSPAHRFEAALERLAIVVNHA